MSNSPEGTSDEMRSEYDFSQMKIVGRGVHHDRYWRAKGGRLLEPELATEFSDDAAVNEALRDYLRIKKQSA